jgi:O-antigen ligase
MYEHAISIFDPAGTGTYINGESGDPGANNRFRLVWWRDVIDETLATNPVLGLGFGSDLAARFMADYDLLLDETFAARSPHSMIVTVFGRMGGLGLLAWIAVSAGMARMVWRLFKGGTPDGRGLASIVCVIWLSACVGVVLESPMAAVIFWTVVGLASSSLGRDLPRGLPQPAKAARDFEPAECPVAKTAALRTQSSPR